MRNQKKTSIKRKRKQILMRIKRFTFKKKPKMRTNLMSQKNCPLIRFLFQLTESRFYPSQGRISMPQMTRKQASLGGLGLSVSWTLALHRKQRSKAKEEEEEEKIRVWIRLCIGSEMRRHFEVPMSIDAHTEYTYAIWLRGNVTYSHKGSFFFLSIIPF